MFSQRLHEDTIAAIATAVGGAVGIVRVSGPDAFAVAARIVHPWPLQPPSHKLWRAEAAGDDILCAAMPAPNSYTGEDVVELHGHGGVANLRALLDAALAAGARMAEPGEFTRRAYVNGRMDLAQAEAVAGLIAARSEQEVRLAQANLRGALSTVVAAIRDRIVSVLATLEADLDFPEEHLDPPEHAAIRTEVATAHTEVTRLLGTWKAGRLLSEGLTVALVGEPNAGKSSLFNALAGEERAVVTDQPGTTRDFIELMTEWDGVAVTLIDTAGTRQARDVAEQRAVELGHARAQKADVVIRVIELGQRSEVGENLQAREERADIIAWSKADLAPTPRMRAVAPGEVVTSAVQKQGLEDLKAACLDWAGWARLDPMAGLVASERQHQTLLRAGQALAEASRVLEQALPDELACADLRRGLTALSSVLGEEVGDAVLDEVFARFCIGK